MLDNYFVILPVSYVVEKNEMIMLEKYADESPL